MSHWPKREQTNIHLLRSINSAANLGQCCFSFSALGSGCELGQNESSWAEKAGLKPFEGQPSGVWAVGEPQAGPLQYKQLFH